MKLKNTLGLAIAAYIRRPEDEPSVARLTPANQLTLHPFAYPTPQQYRVPTTRDLIYELMLSSGLINVGTIGHPTDPQVVCERTADGYKMTTKYEMYKLANVRDVR